MTEIREATAKSILAPVSGFLKEAGFTHSLSPARNCTYGCQYCYVPTMGVFGGLKPEDTRAWGQFTTFKANAAELAARRMGSGQIIYCSPLVDPYQPAEREYLLMPELLRAVAQHPPSIFVLQSRGPLILRDLPLLQEVAARTKLRISFSITTDREDVRQKYEPRCEPIAERLAAIERLRLAGLEVYATLAPLLPCNPENLVRLAIGASQRDLIGDPLHIREAKPRGATTRKGAIAIGRRRGESAWFDVEFQGEIVRAIGRAANAHGHQFATGPLGFGWLTRP